MAVISVLLELNLVGFIHLLFAHVSIINFSKNVTHVERWAMFTLVLQENDEEIPF